MSDYEKALLKCLEAFSSMVTQVAVLCGERPSEKEVRSFNRAYGKWNAAHQDLERAMKEGE